MLKKQIISLFIFLSGIITMSQNTENYYQIKGVITNASDSILAYATVTLYNLPQEQLVEGKLSDQNGEFIFNNINKGTYRLKISFIGYKTVLKDNIIITGINDHYDFGNIKMHVDINTLNEVQVVQERLKGEELVDRTVYNMIPSLVKAAGSGLDLLRLIPAVHIDNDNNISLEGSQNIEIYVDGRLVNNEYVFSLNPEQIDKIEVINNPSAAYDSEITGVIRIITKNRVTRGGNAGINLKVPAGEDYNSNNTLNYFSNYDKLSVEFNMFARQVRWNDYRNISRNSWMEDTTEMLQTGTEDPEFNAIQPSLKLGYFINNKNTISLYAHYAYRNFGKVQHMSRKETLFSNGSVFADDFKTIKKFDWEYFNDAYSLLYRKTFNRHDAELLTSLSYSSWHDEGIDYNNDWYAVNPDSSEIRTFTRKDSEKVLAGKTDFSAKINENNKLETGIAFSNQKLKDNLVGVVNGFNDSITNSKDSLNYDEMRLAGYISLSGELSSFNWMMGCRLENSQILINNTTKAGYTVLLPNITLQKKLEGKRSFKLSYRRSIIRPRSNHLNPFLKQNEKMTYEKGDPNIEPALINNFNFSFNHSKEKNMVSPRIYFRYAQDNINRVGIISEDGILTKTWQNGGDSYQYGFQFSGQVQPFKWWAINPYLEIGKEHIKGIDNPDFLVEEQDEIEWEVNISSIMTFYKDLNIVADFYMSSPSVSLQTRHDRAPYYNLRIEKGLFKEKGKIGLDIFTPFTKVWLAEKTINETNNEFQHFKQVDKIELYFDYRITVVFSYKLNWGESNNKMNLENDIINSGRGGGF